MISITLDKKNSILLKGCREDLLEARRFVSQCLEGSSFSDRDQRLLTLAVDESLSHIVSYSEVIKDPHGIRLGVEVDKTRFVARIQDSRTDFTDLLRGMGEEDLKRHATQARLGIYLIRQIMDEVKYTYHRGFENELVLLKFVPSNS